MELKNKNVFVTGSTRGIGLAVAHKFASLGANVVLNGRSEISEDLLAQFADYGVTVVGISGDISNGEDAQRMVAEAIEKLGSVDVLVNNAGITNDRCHYQHVICCRSHGEYRSSELCGFKSWFDRFH